ncbi:MAG: glycosyltransferase family 4 protein [Paludibacteraceae bacterium]|nr:glycosyltransferase family 4 protein [Paludibacteraceae bacterium]
MSHVLFISHARGVHGAEAVMVQAVNACAAAGARVTVVVPSIAPDEGLETALVGISRLRLLALPYRASGVSNVRTRLVQVYNIPALLWLNKYVQREQVDTVYSCSSITVLGAALARMTGIRHIWHWHESVDTHFGWNTSLRPLYRRLALRATTLICISHQQQEDWERELGVALSNVQVVYNPMKPIPSKPHDSSLAHKEVRVGFIGHFEARKNIPMLVQAFERLHAEFPDTALWLCGANSEEDRLCVERMTALHEPEIKVLPQTADVAAFYHQIDILVLPSWRETMPLVVPEAMQAGVCVLQTDRSGMKERIEDGTESLFFPPDEPDTLHALLVRCMDANYRKNISEAGQKKAMQLIKNESFGQQIQSLICAS